VILAIETASTDPGVALAADDGASLASDAWTGAPGQGRELLPRILALLDAAHRELAEVSAVAVGLGPGSFTGLRVGMSLAKGLAIGIGVPIVGIGSLQAWLAAEPDAAAAVGRAGAHEAYLLLRGDAETQLVERDALPAGAREGAVVAPRELAAAFGLLGAIPPDRAALAVARMAAERLAAAPAGDEIATLEPRYLRAPRGIAEAAGGLVRWQ
jgi:tRNA threonylcarbamoyladenosine biosynthesis protein TsaB